MKKIALLFFLGFLTYSCGQNETWTGYVYPNANNLFNSNYMGAFSSLEECRSSCRDEISRNGYSNADYECGLNCKLKNGRNVCEKTSR